MPTQRKHKNLPPLFFLKLGLELKDKKISSEAVNHQRFKSWYGVNWKLMSVLWNLLGRSGWTKKLKQRPNPAHMLWALSFLKAYKKEADFAADVKKEEKTFRKWAWFYAKGIAKLVSRVVSFTLFKGVFTRLNLLFTSLLL